MHHCSAEVGVLPAEPQAARRDRHRRPRTARPDDQRLALQPPPIGRQMGHLPDAGQRSTAGCFWHRPARTGGPTGVPQKRFMIERKIPGASDLSQAELADIAKASNDIIADWTCPTRGSNSYVASDEIYCCIATEDVDTILEHARRGGFPADAVSVVATSRPRPRRWPVLSRSRSRRPCRDRGHRRRLPARRGSAPARRAAETAHAVHRPVRRARAALAGAPRQPSRHGHQAGRRRQDPVVPDRRQTSPRTFRDGVAFVDLVTVTSDDIVVTAVTDAVGAPGTRDHATPRPSSPPPRPGRPRSSSTANARLLAGARPR